MHSYLYFIRVVSFHSRFIGFLMPKSIICDVEIVLAMFSVSLNMRCFRINSRPWPKIRILGSDLVSGFWVLIGLEFLGICQSIPNLTLFWEYKWLQITIFYSSNVHFSISTLSNETIQKNTQFGLKKFSFYDRKI
jgi:hypothetical protein